ncbi:alpha/beta hydrolase-fold protein [Pigmentiphaga soli]|uniref:Alpha/beta hydrolase-fold protein n=1 Tax=Pigmentiphaga soli TaxID=1007095 RepID=A0ABP8H0Q8_9BURK
MTTMLFARHEASRAAAPAGRSAAQRAADQPAEIIDDPRIERFDLAAEAGAASWHIQVARPAGPPPAGCAVLYLLDGDATFPLAWHAQAAAGIRDLALVGIGYPGGRRIDVRRRYYDLTPPTAAEYMRVRDPAVRTGGQDAFLDFIAGPLRDAVARIAQPDPARQTLFGHSLGGLFALHAMMTRPALFRSYAAADPSIWWNGQSILREAAAFAGGIDAAGGTLARPVRLQIETSGSLPPTLGRARDDAAREGEEPAAHGLAHRLAAIAGFEVYLRHEAHETHGSLMAPSTVDAVAFAAGAVPDGVQRLAR